MQQAEKDYQIAEFYRRTGHPCSAYFYYEIVRRRYPGTKYFDLATHQIEGLRVKLEKAQAEQEAAATAPSNPEGVPRPEPSLLDRLHGLMPH
jgi:outer membrane protein assembly factor BamD (BamD/ComL family)